MGAYEKKQEIRDVYEEVTDPDNPQPLVAIASPILTSLLAIRSGVNLLRTLIDDREPPSPEHAIIHDSMMQGVKERLTAFELEILNVFIDEAWAINQCNCAHCQKVAQEAEIKDKARKAKFN
jgi:hypothetical protein